MAVPRVIRYCSRDTTITWQQAIYTAENFSLIQVPHFEEISAIFWADEVRCVSWFAIAVSYRWKLGRAISDFRLNTMDVPFIIIQPASDVYSTVESICPSMLTHLETLWIRNYMWRWINKNFRTTGRSQLNQNNSSNGSKRYRGKKRVGKMKRMPKWQRQSYMIETHVSSASSSDSSVFENKSLTSVISIVESRRTNGYYYIKRKAAHSLTSLVPPKSAQATRGWDFFF